MFKWIMRIGIDIHISRFSKTGLYTYVSNLISYLAKARSVESISLFLYGFPWMKEPEQVYSMMSENSLAQIKYLWPEIPLKTFSRGKKRRTQSLANLIDKKVIFPIWKELMIPRSRVSLYASKLLSAINLGQELQAEDIDVFHHPAGLVFPLEVSANVMTISDLIPLKVPYYCVGANDWFGDSFKAADKVEIIITYSEYVKYEVMETLKMPEDRIRVVPLAAHNQYRSIKDMSLIESKLSEYGILTQPYILYIGSLEGRKNLVRLIEAFYMLKKEAPQIPHQLILVGPKSWMHELVFEAIDNLDLQSDVKWLGYVAFEDLPFLLNGADLFVFPSLYEGFGLPPLEAMSCGVPVACSRATSLPEVVGDAGLMFNPYSVKEIAEVMYKALTDDCLRRKLVEKGLQRATKFTWEKTSELTLNAYKEASSTPKSSLRKKGGNKVETKAYKHMIHWVVEALDSHYENPKQRVS